MSTNGSKMPTCPYQHLALQKGNARTLILSWTNLSTLWKALVTSWWVPQLAARANRRARTSLRLILPLSPHIHSALTQHTDTSH